MSLEFPEILNQNHHMLSLTEFGWVFQNNTLWDTRYQPCPILFFDFLIRTHAGTLDPRTLQMRLQKKAVISHPHLIFFSQLQHFFYSFMYGPLFWQQFLSKNLCSFVCGASVQGPLSDFLCY